MAKVKICSTSKSKLHDFHCVYESQTCVNVIVLKQFVGSGYSVGF